MTSTKMYATQSDGTISRKFVKGMAKKFEELSKETSLSFEANFKQCNWWLDTKTSDHCFDDLAHDPSAPTDITTNDQYTVNADITTHTIAIDKAEIANEVQETINQMANDGNRTIIDDPNVEHLFDQLTSCLRFPSQTTNVPNEKTSASTFTLNSERSSDVVAEVVTDSNAQLFSSLPVIVTPPTDEMKNRPISLTSTISQASTSSNTSSLSSSTRTSQSSSSICSVSSGQITNTVEELLYNEETYIRSLNYGINGYMKNFNRKGMPKVLRGQMYRIFGNVHRIKDFHENIFFPALKQCNMDIVKICNTFCDFIEKDYFYIYISYAINRKKSEKMCITQSAYFKKIQDEIGDKLGVNSFLVQPIQRLPKYRLLLGQLFSELGKRFGLHDDSIKNEIGACCLAEKRIQRLLNVLDGSVEISDIIDCDLHTLCQGKFILVSHFEIYEKSDQRRRYKGKLFLFEKCIIYTETISKSKLVYRGHFRHATLGFTFEDQRNYFRLYNERKGNQEIEFSADAAVIQLWIQMLNRTMTAVVEQEKKKIKENRFSMRTDERFLSPIQVLVRHTTPVLRDIAVATIHSDGTDSSSATTDASYRNTGDYSNAETASIKSSTSRSDSILKKTTWYTEFDGDERRLIERFQNSEKFFIQLLKNAMKTYLIELSDDLRTTLNTFLDTIQRIVKFHADTFHPKLVQCELKTITICDLIKTHLDNLDFHIYLKYAAFVHEAIQLIRDFHLNSEHDISPMSDGPSDEIETLLLMPVNHISNYAQFLESLLNEYKVRTLLGAEFKTIAAVEIEMKKLHKLVTENYTLNSMKGHSCVAHKYGIINYSDEISVDFTKCRIMILDMGLVCVKIRLSTKTKREKFIDQLFSIPILNIELHENDAYPRKMKIIADNASHVNYTVTFATTRKKKQFMDAIRKQRNSPNRK